jgi:hypothetical protein
MDNRNSDFDIAQARADWSAASAKYDEDEERFLAMRHAPAPAMPDALRARPDDDSYLRDSIEIFPGSDVGDAYEKVAAELRGFKSRNFLFWSDIPPGIANGRKRADEIIAADEAWRAARKRRETEIEDLAAAQAELLSRLCNTASAILTAPPSREALSLKLAVFRYWLETDPADTIEMPLMDGDPRHVAVGIVSDIITMLDRGDAMADIAMAAA